MSVIFFFSVMVCDVGMIVESEGTLRKGVASGYVFTLAQFLSLSLSQLWGIVRPLPCSLTLRSPSPPFWSEPKTNTLLENT